MEKITTVGLDLAKSIFQVHAIAEDGSVVMRRGLRRSQDARRLISIPGVGPLIAATVRASVQDPGSFKTGRDFSAWIGITPRAHSSGGKERLGKVSKQGNKQ